MNKQEWIEILEKERDFMDKNNVNYYFEESLSKEQIIELINLLKEQ